MNISMEVRWSTGLFLLVIGHLLVEGMEDQLLDVSTAVTVDASTSYYAKSRLQFAPQLAIQADTSRQWSSCFVSNKEANPWLQLQFKSAISIFNVRLVVRTVGGGWLPSDFDLMGMDNLTVYVSNSSTLGSSDQQRCADRWKYESTTDILIDCTSSPIGRYLYVTISSNIPTYLLICSIVLNREKGPQHPLNWSADGATVVSSGYNSSHPPQLAIDGNLTAIETCCSLLTGSGTTWLRADIQTPRYIKEVRLLFYGTKARLVLFVGQSLVENGASGNTRCGVVSSGIAGFQWQNVTCSMPILGQFIYIQTMANSMRICEIEVFYDNVMNIYHAVNVTASDQSGTSSAIWKPIDGLRAPHDLYYEDSWVSLPSSNAWYRVELPWRSAISSVTIYTKFVPSSRIADMNGFAVYVGDSVIGNGNRNAICGMPWTAPTGVVTLITIECLNAPVGKYLYVAGAKRSDARIYLNEISITGCEATARIATTFSDQSIDYLSTTSLLCTAVGCPYITIEWIGPNGMVLPTSQRNSTNTVTSTLNVTIGEAAEGGGQYMCTATNAGGSDSSMQATLSVSPKIILPPMSVAITARSSVELRCTAAGYPTVNITWTDPTGNTLSANSTLRVGNKVTSTVSVTNHKGADGGGNYTCTPSNADKIGASYHAAVTVYPDITIYPSSRLIVKDGETVGLLECVTNGYPEPTITWNQNNTNISVAVLEHEHRVKNRFDQVLDVGTAVLSDNGTVYVCVVTQGSTVVNKSVLLIVHRKVEHELLDISTPVTVNSSTSYYAMSGLQFAPQLAIQADTTREWSSCFVSKKETNPWLQLQFKSAISIFNVRLVVKTVADGQLPSDFDLMGMDNLTVYISNSSMLGSSDQQRCADPWKYESTTNILVDCTSSPIGRYLYVTTVSNIPTYLLICSIVLNREKGPQYPLNFLEHRATVISSGYNSSHPPQLAIDGNSTVVELFCSSLTGSGTTWLRVDIQTPRYIREVRLLFSKENGRNDGIEILIGQSLAENGAKGNLKCGVVPSGVAVSQWQNVTCLLPILGQFIFVRKIANSMRLCEIKFFYDNIMNIYRPFNFTASDQSGTSSAIWKPIDGIRIPHVSSYKDSWVSLPSSNAWWRLELPRRSAISSVMIYTRFVPSSNIADMNGFAVYVGDSGIGNGNTNAICGMPWAAPITEVTLITIECPYFPVGKYLYVAGAKRSDARIYLSEISIFGCEVTARISTTFSDQAIDYLSTASLQCTAVGCPPIAIEWTGPNGTILATSERNSTNTVTSTLNVASGQAAEGGGQYMCTATNAGGSDFSMQATLSVSPKIILPPISVTVAANSIVELSCTAAGYPTVNVTWTDPTGNTLFANSTLRVGNKVTSTVSFTSDGGADGGGNYTCTPSNANKIGASSHAVITVTRATESGSSDKREYIVVASVSVGIALIIAHVVLIGIWRHRRRRNQSNLIIHESEGAVDKDTVWVTLKRQEGAEDLPKLPKEDLAVAETNCAYGIVDNDDNDSVYYSHAEEELPKFPRNSVVSETNVAYGFAENTENTNRYEDVYYEYKGQQSSE